MTLLSWGKEKNLEYSLIEHLRDVLEYDDIKVLTIEGDEQSIQVVAGWQKDESWSLPVITVYSEGRTAPRDGIGSNIRLQEYLIVIGIHALDEGMRADLAEWVRETINDGWDYYEYNPNTAQPEEINRSLKGTAQFNYVTDTPVRLGENVDVFDKYRHNITISVYIGDC